MKPPRTTLKVVVVLVPVLVAGFCWSLQTRPFWTLSTCSTWQDLDRSLLDYGWWEHKFIELPPRLSYVIVFESRFAEEEYFRVMERIISASSPQDSPRIYRVTESGIDGYDIELSYWELEAYLKSRPFPTRAVDLMEYAKEIESGGQLNEGN